MSNRKEVMTPEEFLLHCTGGSDLHRDKGKSRLNRARSWYAAYCRVHRSTSLYDLLGAHGNAGHFEQGAMKVAARERDAGISMVIVEEFLK